MDLLSLLLTLLLLTPPIVIAALWRASRRRRVHRHGELPDAEALVLARVGSILCSLLPLLQMGASLIRYKTGEPGLYFWYLVPIFGVLLAVAALAGILAYARGDERKVSAGMVLLSMCILLLITFVGVSGEV